jgi:hypothetical protein
MELAPYLPRVGLTLQYRQDRPKLYSKDTLLRTVGFLAFWLSLVCSINVTLLGTISSSSFCCPGCIIGDDLGRLAKKMIKDARI